MIKIISGGQTGADQGALDAAIELDIPHGGWIPKGRLAEDGPLPRCTCPEGNACYHFLGAPVTPPNEPSPCPLDRVSPNSL